MTLRWFFVVYAGVGLTALPLDLILEYVNRPIRMKKDEFTNARNKLAIELGELKNKGSGLREDAAKAKQATGCIVSPAKDRRVVAEEPEERREQRNAQVRGYRPRGV